MLSASSILGTAAMGPMEYMDVSATNWTFQIRLPWIKKLAKREGDRLILVPALPGARICTGCRFAPIVQIVGVDGHEGVDQCIHAIFLVFNRFSTQFSKDPTRLGIQTWYNSMYITS